MSETHFSVDKCTLTVSRNFDAPIDLVWKAWTEAELLDLWWAPKPWRSETKQMDFKEGGHRLYAMIGPEDEKHWGRTDYQSITPHQSISGKDSFCDNEGNINVNFPIARFQNQFIKEAGHTVVTVVTEYDSEEYLKQVIQMGMKEGLSLAFQNLDEVLKNINQ